MKRKNEMKNEKKLDYIYQNLNIRVASKGTKYLMALDLKSSDMHQRRVPYR